MKTFAFILAAGLACVAFTHGSDAAPDGKNKLTPEQKAKCERFEDHKLRNHRTPGTQKGPKFCAS